MHSCLKEFKHQTNTTLHSGLAVLRNSFSNIAGTFRIATNKMHANLRKSGEVSPHTLNLGSKM